MSAVERPTDGPDTELAAIVADLDDLHTEAASVAMRSEGSVTAAAEEVRDDVASIRDRLRAVLARPAAGRDLTADDVRLALVGMGYYPPVDDAHYAVTNYLNGIARPAVARTDGQPPAGELRSSRWLVKDGPDSILGSFATRSAAEEAQERVRPAYPTAWVEEYPARSAAPADDTAADPDGCDYPGHPDADRMIAIAQDIDVAKVDRTGGVYDQVRTLLAERDHRNQQAAADAMGLRGDWGLDSVEEALGDAFAAYRGVFSAVQPVRDSQDGGA